MTRPRLVTGARLRYDEVREEHLLLVPEGAVRLNPRRRRCSSCAMGSGRSTRSLGVLSARYGGADVVEDVRGLLDGMAERGLLVDADA